jgi:hypothetical protein
MTRHYRERKPVSLEIRAGSGHPNRQILSPNFWLVMFAVAGSLFPVSRSGTFLRDLSLPAAVRQGHLRKNFAR